MIVRRLPVEAVQWHKPGLFLFWVAVQTFTLALWWLGLARDIDSFGDFLVQAAKDGALLLMVWFVFRVEWSAW